MTTYSPSGTLTFLVPSLALRDEPDPSPQAEKVEYEAEIARLRLGMDARDFESAWAEGRLLSMDQAIAYAISNAASVT